MKWHTPKSDDLTGKEVERLGLELYKEIYMLIYKYSVDRISISAVPMDYGCYKLLIALPSVFEIL